jgi:predicted nicotinamide N-methyase
MNRGPAESASRDVAQLREELAALFPLRELDIRIGEQRIRLTTAEDIEQLIDGITEDAFRVDERLPYWAELWHSAVALAEFIASKAFPLAEKRVLEIGCGLALPGIIAAATGAHLTCSDFEEHARLAARLNIMQNVPDALVDVVHMDFRHPPAERWPVIIAADVIYEKRFVEPLANFLDRTLQTDGTVLLAEPNRVIAIPFFETLTVRGFRYRRHAHMATLHGRTAEISIYEITRAQVPASSP